MAKRTTAEDDSDSPRPGEVQSVSRALNILTELSVVAEGLRLTDIAKHARLSVSTAHRLLTTMQHADFVHYDANTKLWHVGKRALIGATAYTARSHVVAAAMPFLRELRDATRETANLGAIAGKDVILVAQVESREIVRTITRTGGRVPLTKSGLGKALLAGLPASLLETFLPTDKDERAQLQRAINEVVQDGFAVNDSADGLRCIAAPIRSDGYAISISGLADRISDGQVRELGALVTGTASAISASLEEPHEDLGSDVGRSI